VRHSTLIGASLAQLADDLLSRVTRPSFGSVEGNDAHRVGVLTLKQVLDEIGALGVGFVGLAPRAPGMAKKLSSTR
jgi:hypothetical protein